MAATTRTPVAGPNAVLDLRFAIEDAAMLQYAASPTISFGLRIECGGPPIRSILLDVQAQIAARRRSYAEGEKDGLLELFGAPDRWSTTLRTLPWVRTTMLIPPFTGETRVELQVPCTYDLEVTASKYFQALGDGEVPLEFLFSGTAFYAGEGGLLQVAKISWESEAEYRLPVRVWRETMDRYFPDSAWIRFSKEAFDRLYAYRAHNALPSWEHVVDSLLPRGTEGKGD